MDIGHKRICVSSCIIQIIEGKRDRRTMIKAGIIGSTGYAGAELVRLLLGHDAVRIV